MFDTYRDYYYFCGSLKFCRKDKLQEKLELKFTKPVIRPQIQTAASPRTKGYSVKMLLKSKYFSASLGYENFLAGGGGVMRDLATGRKAGDFGSNP